MVKCPFCYPLGTSSSEQELIDFCHQFFNDLKTHDRTLIKPYELDIVIPEIKLALEFNGIWYHSIEAGTPPGYHLMKTEMCEAKGYRLIHVWEDEWINNNQQIKNDIKKLFNNDYLISYEDNDKIIFDRSNTSLLQLKTKFNLIKKINPELIVRDKFHVENCGKLIVTK